MSAEIGRQRQVMRDALSAYIDHPSPRARTVLECALTRYQTVWMQAARLPHSLESHLDAEASAEDREQGVA